MKKFFHELAINLSCVIAFVTGGMAVGLAFVGRTLVDNGLDSQFAGFLFLGTAITAIIFGYLAWFLIRWYNRRYY